MKISQQIHKWFFKLIPNYFFRDRDIPKVKSYHNDFTSSNFTVIQIGANDGVLFDPINYYLKKYDWSGVLVEPVNYYYKKLQQTYINQNNIQFAKVAICDKNKKQNIYTLESDHPGSRWFDGISSFNKDHFLRFKETMHFPDIEKYIKAEKVECLTLESLLKRYNVNQVDLLVVDVEGYEYNILRQIEDLKIKPRVILYEHAHIPVAEEKRLTALLKKLGYKLKKVGFIQKIDTLAVLNS